VNTAEPVQLTSGSIDSNPACSADGKRVMYSTNRLPHVSVWQVPIEPGESEALVPTESYDALPSPRDGLMYYSTSHRDGPTRSGRWIIRALSDSKPLYLIVPPPNKVRGVHPVWAPDHKGLDFVVTTMGVSNVWRQPVTGGPPVQLTHYTSGKIFSLAWSPDGRWLSMAMGANRSDVVTLSR
jgi:Tol biopolymer transport system component